MDRNQSYELDDAMSLRDSGEVILVDADRPVTLRTPGVSVAPQAGENAFHPLTDADRPTRATGMAGVEVEIPVLGKVNLVHMAIAAGAGALICYLIAGRKKS
jgi:hypothetical protein